MSSLKNNVKNRHEQMLANNYENCIRVYGDSGKFSIFYSVCARFERERVSERVEGYGCTGHEIR